MTYGYTDVMIDLETLGTSTNSPVIQYGIVLFNIGDMTDAQGSCGNVNLEDRYNDKEDKAGISYDTLRFWLETYDRRAMLSDLFNNSAAGLREVHILTDLEDKFNAECMEGFRVWGNAASFDIAIFKRRFAVFGKDAPFTFRQERCFRTIKKAFSDVPEPAFVGVRHNALDDAIHQARWLSAIYNYAKERGINIT